MKSESSTQREIRLYAASIGIDLYRNNRGACMDQTGRLVRFGLGNDSKELDKYIKSSDLIGTTPVPCYILNIGWTIAGVFTAVECKKPDWKFNPNNQREIAQKRFIDIILKAGGFAGFATCVEDFKRIISYDRWRHN